MRVVVFGERLAPPPDEGIKKLTLRLSSAFRGLGHEVRTVTTGGADWPDEQVMNVPADRLLRSPELAAILDHYRPAAVVYVPTASLTLASGVRAARLRRYARGAPVGLVATQGRRHTAAVRLAARIMVGFRARPEACVALSEATARQARGLGWPVVRAEPGVDRDIFHPVSFQTKLDLRRLHGLPPDAFVVLHAGHLNERRGVRDLAALTGIASPVLLASTSTLQDAALAEELRQAGVRVVTEFVHRVEEYYQLADAYLFPAPPDPTAPSSIDIPLSVLEALACDLPVVSTRFGGLPALWPDGRAIRYYEGLADLRSAMDQCRRDQSPGPALPERYGWPYLASRILESLVASS